MEKSKVCWMSPRQHARACSWQTLLPEAAAVVVVLSASTGCPTLARRSRSCRGSRRRRRRRRRRWRRSCLRVFTEFLALLYCSFDDVLVEALNPAQGSARRRFDSLTTFFESLSAGRRRDRLPGVGGRRVEVRAAQGRGGDVVIVVVAVVVADVT